jgi:hypothetical protein
MHQNCQECTRLWNEYALATRHFLNMEGKLKTASLSRDENAVRELSPVVERAAAERAHIRQLIEQHEAEAAGSRGRPRSRGGLTRGMQPLS